MKPTFSLFISLFALSLAFSEEAPKVKLPPKIVKASVPVSSSLSPFTGKISGTHVRIRTGADMESPVVADCKKGDLVVVEGEKGDFFAVTPPQDLKVYVFRSFILDGCVEANHVNVRLAPDLSAPVVGFLNAGEKVAGEICNENHKWLKIAPPKNTHLYIAKEYIEKIGGPEIKQNYDKRCETVQKLMETSLRFSESEMLKPFEEIAFERISQNFNSVINNYNDFAELQEKAKSKLRELQETYLQKKLAYLEAKAVNMSRTIQAKASGEMPESGTPVALDGENQKRFWEKVEESLFLEWSTSHYQKTIADFYEEQKLSSSKISGVVEPYIDTVKNKPGQFILRDRSRDVPIAYLYSTFLDLGKYVGKSLTLTVAERPNNNFAFPAYFVLSAE